MATTADGFQLVHGTEKLHSNFPDDARFHFKVQSAQGERYLSLVKTDGQMYCIDSVCFHAGGPLAVGDIEDLLDQKVIVCPWHYYKISLSTGDKFYQTLEKNPEGRMVPGEWKSIGAKQRTHPVDLRPDGIYVKVVEEGKVDSDRYACNHECGERVMAGGVKPGLKTGSGGVTGGDGKLDPHVHAKGEYRGPGMAPWSLGFTPPPPQTE